jgi:hypothetical protein
MKTETCCVLCEVRTEDEEAIDGVNITVEND